MIKSLMLIVALVLLCPIRVDPSAVLAKTAADVTNCILMSLKLR